MLNERFPCIVFYLRFRAVLSEIPALWNQYQNFYWFHIIYSFKFSTNAPQELSILSMDLLYRAASLSAGYINQHGLINSSVWLGSFLCNNWKSVGYTERIKCKRRGFINVNIYLRIDWYQSCLTVYFLGTHFGNKEHFQLLVKQTNIEELFGQHGGGVNSR